MFVFTEGTDRKVEFVVRVADHAIVAMHVGTVKRFKTGKLPAWLTTCD